LGAGTAAPAGASSGIAAIAGGVGAGNYDPAVSTAPAEALSDDPVLASLCLRLALSRTLARQRGVETGFVILDGQPSIATGPSA
jgi:hypothetical protein